MVGFNMVKVNKLKNKIYSNKVFFSILILISILFVFLLWNINLVVVRHGTIFTKDFYHYTIEIFEENQLYFNNVNKNEISLTKVIPSNKVGGTDFFFTFESEIKIVIITESYDTTRYVPLDKYTKIDIYPTFYYSRILSSSKNEIIYE